MKGATRFVPDCKKFVPNFKETSKARHEGGNELETNRGVNRDETMVLDNNKQARSGVFNVFTISP
jgi:hypothetical protein